MSPSTEAFFASLARFYAEEGLPAVAGRMLGWLMLRTAPCSTIWQPGCASVKAPRAPTAGSSPVWALSTSAASPGDRRDFYEASSQLSERRLEQFLLRLTELGGCLTLGARASEAAGAASERLAQTLAMNSLVADEVRPLLARLRGEGPPGPS